MLVVKYYCDACKLEIKDTHVVEDIEVNGHNVDVCFGLFQCDQETSQLEEIRMTDSQRITELTALLQAVLQEVDPDNNSKYEHLSADLIRHICKSIGAQ